MYSMTIVGAGNIACGYDSPKLKYILTHIHAAIKHPAIKLDSIIETEIKKHKNILNKWGGNINIYSDLKDSMSIYKSDIFVVANPTDQHLLTIKKILKNHSPKLIICEKPIVSNLKELKNLYELFEKHNTKIITNFPRRFEPSLNILKKKILKLKQKYHFYGTFNKGLIHNGSHMIDLINMLVGNINKIDSIDHEIINNDFFGKFLIKTDNCNGVISNINSQKLAIFELIIFSKTLKIEIIGSDKNILINHIQNSSLYKNFKNYVIKNELPRTPGKSAMNTFDFAIGLLKNNKRYEKFKLEQFNTNKIIFDTKKKFINN